LPPPRRNQLDRSGVEHEAHTRIIAEKKDQERDLAIRDILLCYHQR
jgi:hypothetical protein